MLGNLSKLLMKTPTRFINENTNALQKSANLGSFSTLNPRHPRGGSHHYFKERDFWRNMKIDINFNNNRRNISPKVIKNPSISFDEFMARGKERYFGANNRTMTNQAITENNYSPKTTGKFQHIRPRGIGMLYRSVEKRGGRNEDFDLGHSVKTIPNVPSQFSGKNKYKKKIAINNLKQNFFRRGNMDYGKEMEKGNEGDLSIKEKTADLFGEWKFPKVLMKSQDTLYRECVDKKLGGLAVIKPSIREQLVEKNRNMVGRRQFYRFLNQYQFKNVNPFYESVKFKEENNL